MPRFPQFGRGILFFLLALHALPADAQDSRPTLYAYLHTETKSAALQKSLQDKLPGLVVTVFGRFRDFEEAMNARRPDVVIGLPVLLANRRVPVVLQGLRGDHDWEPYVLLATGTGGEDPLTGKTIGVVDVLGRDGTQELVTKLLKTTEIKLKRVTKIEDLLPLLQFAAVDAVLVPAAAVKSITERSRLQMRVRELPDARVGLPAVGVLKSELRDGLLKQILGLDGEINRTIGVEKWRAR